MKEQLKGIVIGFSLGLTIAVTSAFAATGGMQKWIDYNDIKLSINGTIVEPKDANGNYVEPFTIDGTTYLPVRAVANALGLQVGWDGETSTVLLSENMNESQPLGTLLYEKDGVKITYNGIKQDDYSCSFHFLIENDSEKQITVQARNESINGFMISGIMSDEVMPGKKANGDLTYYYSALEENGISSIEELEMSFHIFDTETWDTLDDSDMITIKP